MLFRAAVRGTNTVGRNALPLVKERLTKLSSGLVVASSETRRPSDGDSAHFVLGFPAGFRYETSEQKGLVYHIHRIMSHIPMKIGSKKILLPTGTRINPIMNDEHLGVRVSVPRNYVDIGLEVLSNMAAFSKCDLDILPNESEWPSPNRIVGEKIREAAFGNKCSLGHPYFPMFSSDLRKFTDDELRNFASTRMVANHAALYGVNVDHEKLCAFGEANVPGTMDPVPCVSAAPYLGGEWRKEARDKLAHVIIAGEGAAAGDVHALAVQTVLMTTLGYQDNGRSAGLFDRIPNFGYANFTCRQQLYEGVGIVLVKMESSPSCVGNVVMSVVGVIKSFETHSFKYLKDCAKKRLISYEAKLSPVVAASARTKEILAGRENGAVLASIDNVTESQVKAAAARFASNISIAAYGNIANVPYRDQL